MIEDCLSSLMNESKSDTTSISEARDLKRWLNDPTFLFFLFSFRNMFLCKKILFSTFQSRSSSLATVSNAVSDCADAIQSVRTEADGIAIKDDAYLQSSPK